MPKIPVLDPKWWHKFTKTRDVFKIITVKSRGVEYKQYYRKTDLTDPTSSWKHISKGTYNREFARKTMENQVKGLGRSLGIHDYREAQQLMKSIRTEYKNVQDYMESQGLELTKEQKEEWWNQRIQELYEGH